MKYRGTMDCRGRQAAGGRRSCLGGRGREWAGESLKLLEVMQELDDAKIFLEPMDPLKHQDYYTVINDPIDLSKIMLNFHGGSYSSLSQFTRDMRLMFDNYRQYFSTETQPEYHEVRRLAAWYEDEISRITSRWNRATEESSGSNSPVNVTTRTATDIDSFEARVRAIEALNEQIVGPPMFLSCGKRSNATLRGLFTNESSPATSSSSSKKAISAAESGLRVINPKPCILGSNKPSPVNSAIQVSNVRVSRPVIVLQRTGSTSSITSSSAVLSDNNSHTNGNMTYLSSGALGGSAQLCSNSSSASHVSSPSPAPVPSSSPAPKIALKMEVSNIWLGTVRHRPTQPVILSEDGFHLVLKIEDKDVPFDILSGEIVRCAAYFGNLHKHTLFVFVLPNCSRRLRCLSEVRDSRQSDASSLIIIFLPALSQTQTATLIYLFWRMRALNPFNSDLFSEIDQKAALSLLTNIKPTILSNISDQLITDHLTSGSNSVADVHKIPDVLGTIVTHNFSDSLSSSRNKTKPPCVEEMVGQVKVEPVEEDQSSAEPSLRSRVRRQPGILKRKHAESDGDVNCLQKIGRGEDSSTDSGEERAEGEGERGEGERGEVVEEEVEEESGNFTVVRWYPNDAQGLESGHQVSQQQNDCMNGLQLEEQQEDVEEEGQLEIVVPSADFNPVTQVRHDDDGADDDDVIMTSEEVNIRCPITQQLMRHPVRNKLCGHCYDRQGVEQLISDRSNTARCPVRGCTCDVPLSLKNIQPEYHLWQLIQAKQNGLKSSVKSDK